MVLKVVVITNDVPTINVKMNCILSPFHKRTNSLIFSSENDTLTCNAVTDGNTAPLFIACLALRLLTIQ